LYDLADPTTYTANFLGTYISGPDYLYKGQTGMYNSNPSGGSGNRSYQWYKKLDGSSTWYTRGTSQTQEERMITTAFTVKVEVTDDVYNKTATAIKYVTYGALAEGDSTENSESSGKIINVQNHPNPFNPQTAITYTLATAAHVTLTVFDMLGREVATPVDAWKNAGQQKVLFNGSTCASGVYWCRLQTETTSQMHRMILTK